MTENAHDIHARVKQLKTLPTMPGVVNQLLSMVESDEESAAEVAEIIATDQVLTAKVLKIVNSPFYGFPGRIGTIQHALVLLGFDVLKGIVLSASVIDYMSDSLVGLWEHSIGVATASHKIALAIEADEPEEISTAGLLHDLGKVILSVEMHADCDRVVTEAARSEIPFVDAERKILRGVTHCEIAGWLAEEWHLPARLREPIARHHHPHSAELAPVPTAIVHLADILTRALQFGSGGDPYIPRINERALKILHLKMGDLASLLRIIDNELEGIDTSDFA